MSDDNKEKNKNNVELEEITDEELEKVTGGILNPPRVPVNNYDDKVRDNI
jgi:bacteriocin-like protein